MNDFLAPTALSIFVTVLLFSTSAAAALVEPQTPQLEDEVQSRFEITADDSSVYLTAGQLAREINLKDNNISTTGIRVNGAGILSAPAPEFSMTFHKAVPNERPKGLKPGDAGTIEQNPSMSGETDSLEVKGDDNGVKLQTVEWIEPITVTGNRLSEFMQVLRPIITRPGPGVTRMNIRARSMADNALNGVSINLFYEVYESYPAVRKWIEVTNNSPNWMKIDNLLIDDIEISPEYAETTLLTPEERGACSSVIAFGNKDRSCGILAVSEIPSAARMISRQGAMGYANQNFEWVLGPSESFISEPVFHFAYSGQVEKTISGISTPLDRTIEGPYYRFLKQHIGVRANPENLHVPLWCSWSNLQANVNDFNIREQADIAARIGFVGFQIDAGWAKTLSYESWGCGSTEPDLNKFPDFDSTCRYIKSKGLKLGLWVSCFRYRDTKDFKALPGQILPEVQRREAIAMSFASSWRDYYANDMVYLHDRYGAVYIKQDFTSIKYGDIAEGHDSRTRKESLLRGLRGLLESQDTIARLAPEMSTEITHEIYWGTPGVPCDIAVLKHACTYHIPPNDYSGCGNRGERVSDSWQYDPMRLREQLIRGCWNARQRFYAHRGLPLYSLEYYGAATVNFKGSLTPEVQDRQVCSWLMGAPAVYAGDLSSLTEENIERYRSRFEILKRLQKTYDIYRYFQYSGVPHPTDTDWHWWGKLNDQGYGAVVVLRGSAGEDKRRINIPWVDPENSYQVKALLSDKPLGTYQGSQLIKGDLELNLPVYGQEILELAPASKQAI